MSSDIGIILLRAFITIILETEIIWSYLVITKLVHNLVFFTNQPMNGATYHSQSNMHHLFNHSREGSSYTTALYTDNM